MVRPALAEVLATTLSRSQVLMRHHSASIAPAVDARVHLITPPLGAEFLPHAPAHNPHKETPRCSRRTRAPDPSRREQSHRLDRAAPASSRPPSAGRVSPESPFLPPPT